MRIGLRVKGKVVVDHVRDVTKVESAASDVGGDHKAHFLLAKAAEYRSAAVLVEAAVNNLQERTRFCRLLSNSDALSRELQNMMPCWTSLPSI